MKPIDAYQRVWERKLKTAPVVYDKDNFRVELFKQAIAEKWIDPPRDALLDIGCGNGYLLEWAQREFGTAQGIDISQKAVGAARAKGLYANCADVDAGLLFPDKSFTCIACLDVIEHVYEPMELIAEIARVLVPGGYVFMTTPNIMYHGWLRMLIEGHFPITSLDTEMYNGGHLHHLTYYDLADMMRANGLEPKRHARQPDPVPEVWRKFVSDYYTRDSFELDFGDTVVIISGQRHN